MTRVEFETALAAHGANFSRWPVELADDARAFVARDRVAAAQLQEAAALDGLLSEVVEPLAVDSATVGRILAGIAARHVRERAVRPTGKLFAWAGAAMAVFLVAGFVLGLAIPSPAADDDALAALLFGNDSGTSFDVGGIL